MNRATNGKTSKEPEAVDEKNNLKRLKGANQKVETNAKQSEIPRVKTAGAKKTGATGAVLSKNPKSKLRSPAKLKSSNLQPRSLPQPQKTEKRQPLDLPKPKFAMKVQQDTTESVPQPKKKDPKPKPKTDESLAEPAEAPSASDTNGKSSDAPQDNGKGSDNGLAQADLAEPKEIVVSETESINSEVIDLVEISDESLVLDSLQEPDKFPEQVTSDQTGPEQKTSDQKNSEQKSSELSNAANPSEVVVESTTSETCPSEIKQMDPTQSDDQAKPEDDPAFVSYDAAIMLKDVQIKLNDCLRENSKLMDVTDPNASVSEAFKDLSFGRTLRGISGRSSIGRLRHVTLRDRQRTPNDSLFVNTSNVSFSQDDALRYAAGLRDSPSGNGTPVDRKRKIVAEVSNSAKKVKRDDSSLFNTSLEYIKNLRRPVQVSTPKPKAFKFDVGEKAEERNENAVNGDAKKWCLVM